MRAAEVVAHDGADHREHGRDLQGREDERQRGRDPDAAEDRRARPPRRSASARSTRGRTEVSPRSVFTSTGKKQSIAAIAIFESGFEDAEPVVRDRREGDDRDRVRRDRVRHERAAERPPAREHERDEDRRPEPSTKPPSASLKVNQPALQSSSRSSQSVCEDVRERREQEAARRRARARSPPRARSRARRRRAPGIHSRRRRARGGAAHRPFLARRSSSLLVRRGPRRRARRRAARSRTSRDELEEARLLARLCRARLRRGRRRRSPVIRPGRGDMTTTRVERKTASAIEWVTKTTVEPIASQIRSSSHVQPLARHLVERAERLVHQQERGREGERARDRDALLHAARELPRVVLLEPVSSTRSSISSTRSCARRAVPAEQLERQRDVLRDRAPVEEDGVLEDDPVVAVEAGLARGLAVDDDVPDGRLDQVADDAQQRRLAAAGRARSARRTRRGRISRSMSWSAVTPPLPNVLRHVRERDDRLGHAHATCSGARRTTSFSASTTTRKNVIPSSAAIRFVAQRLVGRAT